jgi:hypothetical protein
VISTKLRRRTVKLPLKRAIECRFRAVAHRIGDFGEHRRAVDWLVGDAVA